MANSFDKTNLKRGLRIILIFIGSVFCFLVATVLSAFLLWHFFASIRTKDVSESTPANFPVLVKSVDGNDAFHICNYSDLSDKVKIVDSFDDKSVASINRDLDKKLDKKDDSSFGSIKVIHRKNYTDVRLEAHPDWRIAWYRVHDGKVIPQKLRIYSRGMAYALVGCPQIGIVCAIIFIVIMVLKKPKNTQSDCMNK